MPIDLYTSSDRTCTIGLEPIEEDSKYLLVHFLSIPGRCGKPVEKWLISDAHVLVADWKPTGPNRKPAGRAGYIEAPGAAQSWGGG